MKLHKNQLGALNPLLIVLIVVIVGAIGFVGYKVYDKTSDSDTGASSQATKEAVEAASSECEKQYSDKDFCKFASNWSLAKTYKLTINTTNSTGTASTINMEVDGENTSIVSIQDGKEVAAYINLDKVTYYKSYEENIWYKVPKTETVSPDANPTENLDFIYTDNGTENTTVIKKLDKEACGNKTCFKYQVMDPSDTKTETFIWFDDQDYRLVRMTTKNPDTGTSDIMYASSDNLKITEPSPVKEVPSIDPNTLGL